MASVVVMWFSRWREFRADSGSAQLVGKDKMIAALEALKRDYSQMQEAGDSKSSVQTMGISSKGALLSLFSSHPSLDKRIAALQAN